MMGDVSADPDYGRSDYDHPSSLDPIEVLYNTHSKSFSYVPRSTVFHRDKLRTLSHPSLERYTDRTARSGHTQLPYSNGCQKVGGHCCLGAGAARIEGWPYRSAVRLEAAVQSLVEETIRVIQGVVHSKGRWSWRGLIQGDRVL
jgi:hypothetical protein